MAARKKVSKIREEINAIHEQNELASLKASQSRARSITVGNTTGGLIEIVLRAESHHCWYILNPVEAVEIIEQLAASAGLEILKRPKEDFTSWRSWNLDQPGQGHWKGAAPWQMSDKDRKSLQKFEQQKYGVLPASTIIEEDKPKLSASSKRKKKVEEETEE